jgi:hypothetical protein
MGSVSNWTETILLSIAFIAVAGLVIAGMNGLYGQNNNIGMTDNTTENLFIEYTTNTQTQLGGGEVAFDATQGITLKNSYGIAKDGINLIWSFVSGSWINKIANLMGAGESGYILAKFFRIIWILSLIAAMLYALFKVEW